MVAENKTELVNRALGRVAELEFEAKNYPEAIKAYERLRTASTNRREIANATLGLMRSHYETGDYANTRAVAAQLQALAGATANATNAALLYLGKASLGLKNYEAAATELAAAAAAAPNDLNGAEAQYGVAQALYYQKKYEEAIAAALKVNANFSAYELWQGRAFLLVADAYAAQGDNFQARGTLNSIIDNNFPVPEILEAAKLRLKTLGADEPAPNTAGDTPAPVKGSPKPPKAAPVKTAPTKAPAKGNTPPATAPAATPAPTKPAPAPAPKPRK